MSEQSQKRSMAIVLLIAGVCGAWYVGDGSLDTVIDPQPTPAVVDLANVPEFSHPLVLQLAIHRDHAKAYGNLWASMAKAVETKAASPADLDQFRAWHTQCGKTAGPKIGLEPIGIGPLFDTTVRGVLNIETEPTGETASVYMADRADEVLAQLIAAAEVAFNGR